MNLEGLDWSLVISLELVHNNCEVAIFPETSTEKINLPDFIFFLSQFEFLVVNIQRELTTSF